MNEERFNNREREEERKLYLGKLFRQITGMKSILKEGGVVFDDEKPETRESLVKLLKEAETLYNKLDKREFEIAVVGTENSGKSSFANALMEADILPTATERCTYTATKIVYGDEDKAIVSFYNADTFNKDFKDKLRKLKIANSDRYSYVNLSKDEFDRLYEEAEEQKKEGKFKWEQNLHDDVSEIIVHRDTIKGLLGQKDRIFAAEEMTSDDFKKYITDAGKSRAVSNVTIYSKKLVKMKEAVIYDVPGFNSPTDLHKAQTRERMNDADAIIVVSKGTDPSITDESLNILKESDKEGNELINRLFLFANQMDRHNENTAIEDIRKDIKIIYDEWIDRYRFISEEHKDRIFFGSALAHLQKCGKVAGTKDFDKFKRYAEELNDPRMTVDVVERMRTKLEEYYENDRFEILKTRINSIKPKIRAVLKEILEKDSSGISGLVCSEVIDLFLKIEKEKGRIIHKLQDIKAEIKKNTDIKNLPVEQWPLSKEIVDYIDKNVTSGQYQQRIEEEIEESSRKNSDFRRGEALTSEIEKDVRSNMFQEMYVKFSNNVLNMTEKPHSEYSQKVLDAILDTIGIKKDSSFRESLENALKKDLDSCWHYNSDSGIYFSSLVERYARDIYEVLIRAPYTDERLGKFYDYFDNFFSMSVFYKEHDAKENDFSYITKTLQEQPFCRKLLYHDTACPDEKFEVGKDTLEHAAKHIQEVTDIEKLPEKTLEKLKKALMATCGDEKRIIDSLNIRKMEYLNNDGKTEELDKSLDAVSSGTAPENAGGKTERKAGFADMESFKEEYIDFHNKSKKSRNGYTVAYFKNEFKKDIDTLQDILKNAFVRAISIETPFSVKETNAVEATIAYINSDKFDEFLKNNSCQIQAEEYRELNNRTDREQSNIFIINTIKRIFEEDMN